jgi:hypothetical protein
MREMAEQYNEPPEAPRDAMWVAIQETRRARAERRTGVRAIVRHPALRWGVGIAAALVLGIGIGRVSGPVAPGPVVASDDTQSGAYRWATLQHLGQVETYLSLVRQDAGAQRVQYVEDDGARTLLSTTRLLLDSPAAEDASVRELLEDIELVLAQIAQLVDAQTLEEWDFIDDSLERRGVMLRLQTVVGAADGAL